MCTCDHGGETLGRILTGFLCKPEHDLTLVIEGEQALGERGLRLLLLVPRREQVIAVILFLFTLVHRGFQGNRRR